MVDEPTPRMAKDLPPVVGPHDGGWVALVLEAVAPPLASLFGLRQRPLATAAAHSTLSALRTHMRPIPSTHKQATLAPWRQRAAR